MVGQETDTAVPESCGGDASSSVVCIYDGWEREEKEATKTDGAAVED